MPSAPAGVRLGRLGQDTGLASRVVATFLQHKAPGLTTLHAQQIPLPSLGTPVSPVLWAISGHNGNCAPLPAFAAWLSEETPGL